VTAANHHHYVLVNLIDLVRWQELILRIHETFDIQVSLGQGASFIKTTNVNLASKGNSKRLSAENLLLY
jgi:hypothetical protein